MKTQFLWTIFKSSGAESGYTLYIYGRIWMAGVIMALDGSGSKDKDIVVRQEKDKDLVKNTIDVGTDIRDIEIVLDNVNIEAGKGESAVSIDRSSDLPLNWMAAAT